jgi:GWxTD domain-containing protein
MKKIAISIIVFFLLSFNVHAQNKRHLNLTMDYSRFKMDNENSYVEFYYAYSPYEMKKKIVDNRSYTELLLKFTIIDTITKEVIIDRMWNLRNDFKDSLLEKYMISQSRFLLEYAPYLVKIFAMDINNPNKIDSVSFPLEIQKYTNGNIQMSDIEFCSSIKQIEKDTNNIFYKNTYEVKPNPFSIIPVNYPVLGYYLEVYNLLTKNIGDHILTKYRIYNNTGKEFISKSVTKKIKDGTSVETGMINVGKLTSGAYNFAFMVMDSNGNKLGENSKRFFIYDPDVKAPPKDSVGILSNDEFMLMTEPEVNLMFQQATYIANNEEKKTFKKLTGLEGKKNFMRRFWSDREEDVNYNKKSYLERVALANSKFRTKWNDGWVSDRGRIMAYYGIPQESYVQRGKETTKGKPYEIWFYPELLNGTYFVFVDESGFNNFRLVHSSHPNEVSDEEWKTFLKNNK